MQTWCVASAVACCVAEPGHAVDQRLQLGMEWREGRCSGGARGLTGARGWILVLGDCLGVQGRHVVPGAALRAAGKTAPDLERLAALHAVRRPAAGTGPSLTQFAVRRHHWCCILQIVLRHGCSLLQVVDQDTQKAMMAWYYKKQEEQKVGGVAAARTLTHGGNRLCHIEYGTTGASGPL